MDNVTTFEYWDQLDHPDMACNPSNIAPGFEFVCAFTTKFAATVYLLNAIGFFRVAMLQIQLIQQFPDSGGAKKVSAKSSLADGAKTSGTAVRITVRRMISVATAARGPGVRVAILLGSSVGSSGLAFLISGTGTMFPTSSARGLIGDGFAAFQFWTASYLALIQLRGAHWFNALVNLPTDDETAKKYCRQLPSLSQVLDAIQGPFSIAISLPLWLLLASGVLPRAWFYEITTAFNLVFGLRALIAIITKRISALRKVADIQQEVRGTERDKRRRYAILKSKVAGLVIDLTAVFVMSIAVPLSYLVLNSYYSSRRLVVHYAFAQGLAMTSLLLINVDMYFRVKKKKRRMIKKSAREQASREKSMVTGRELPL